jgi:rRNA biogenesis protein RRP5
MSSRTTSCSWRIWLSTRSKLASWSLPESPKSTSNNYILFTYFRYDLRCQIKNDLFASLDQLEISDEWLQSPLQKYQINQYVPCRVLKLDDKICLTSRASLLDEQNYQNLQKSTMGYKTAFGQSEKQLDYRARLIKFGLSGLKENLVVLGYIKQINDKGCFIRLGFEHEVRATLSELSDGL